MTMRSALRRASSRELVGASLAFVLLAVVWTRPMSLSPAGTIADLGDPVHLAYVMAWDAHQLVRQPWHLFDSNSFHPWPRSLAFGDHLLPEAILTAPVFWTTGNAILAFNLSVMLALVLSGVALFFLVRDRTGSAAGGLAAGLAYAFNGFTLVEIARVQVVHLQWWPLSLLFLTRFLESRRSRDALGFALLLALQGLSGTYYLVYSALMAPLWLAAGHLAQRRLPGRAEVRALLLAFLCAAVPVALLIWPYLGRLGEAEGTVSGGADLFAYVTPGAANPLFGRGASEASYAREFIGYVTGALIVAGALFGVRRSAGERTRVLSAIALVTLAAGALLTLGPVVRVRGVEVMSGPLAWLLEVLPLTSLRHSPRFAALMKLGGAILVGVGVAALARLMVRPMRVAAVAAAAVLVPLEHWQPPLYGARLPAGHEVPAVHRWLATEGAGPMVELPLFSKKRFWALYQYFSTYHWRPIPIGRTSFYPPSHELLAATLSRFPDAVSIDVLDRLEVRTVVVHPQAWEPDERPHWLLELDGAPRLALVRTFTWERPIVPWLAESRVYHITPRADPSPAPCRLEGELPRALWRVVSAVAPGTARTTDDRLDTAWTSQRAQGTGDRLRVSFGGVAEVAAVALLAGAAFGEFPRNPVLEVQDEGGSWSEPPLVDPGTERWRAIEELMRRPLEAAYVMRFAPRPATGFRITLASEGKFTAPWTVAELRAYGGCR